MVEKSTDGPRIIFDKETQIFYKSEEYPIEHISKCSRADLFNEDNISKIQNFSDLKRVKRMFEDLEGRFCSDDATFCINNGFGNRCYLFEEDGEIKIKTVTDNLFYKVFDTKFGLIVCENHGEFGGSLYNITNDGKEILGGGCFSSYESVFEYNDKLYAITTCSHLGSDCSIHEITVFSDRIENVRIFFSWDLEFSGYFAEDNYLYFYSDSSDSKYGGLYRFNLDTYQLEVLHKHLCNGVRVNSLLKKDNIIYIYGSYNVIKYDLNADYSYGNDELEVYTNLDYDQITDSWYVHDMKLLDIWDKLLDIK